MKKSLKKRGQKFIRKFSRASAKASEEGKEHIKENLLERFSHVQNIRLLVFEWALLVMALIMFAVAQAFWSSSSYADDTFVRGGNYIEATLGRVNSLNPLFATTASEKALSKLMFATISKVDYSGRPGAGLASTIQSSEGGKVWTVKLRENLKWSDGEALTNEDVLFTVGLIQNPAVNSIYNSNLVNVKVTENAAGEIVFTLPSVYADFISALEIPVVPKHILENAPVKTLVEAEFSSNPVTSGAFTFNAVQGSATANDDERVYYLSANKNYYGGVPMLSSFAIHTYGTKEDIANAVNAGAVTATAELSGADADALRANNFNKAYTPLNAGAFMFFNMNGRLSDATLRSAIRQGLDMEAIRAMAPKTHALDYPILAAQMTLENYPVMPERNFEAARETIMTMASGDTLQLNIVTANTGYLPAVANQVAEQLRALGINCAVEIYNENQEFITAVVSKRNYDILIYEIEMGEDPDPVPYYHSSQIGATGLNLSNYRNALVDDLLIGARETTDLELRMRKYESFLAYWVEDVPAIGLYQVNMTYIYNKNVRAYGANVVLATALDRFNDVPRWASVHGTLNKTP